MPRRRITGALPLAAAIAAVVGAALMLGGRAGRSMVSGRGSPSTPPSPRAVAAGFEPADMSVRLAGRVLAGLGGTVLASIAALFVMIHVFHRDDADRPPQTAQQTAILTPPAPRLQADPVRELDELRAREQARLHGYAWADESHAQARIPIERAMQLVAGRSLAPPLPPAPDPQGAR